MGNQKISQNHRTKKGERPYTRALPTYLPYVKREEKWGV